MSEHPPDDVLFAYLDRDEEAPTVGEHLAGCATCQETLVELAHFAAALREPAVWERSSESAATDVEPFVQLARRIAEEDRAAAEFVGRLRAFDVETWEVRLKAASESWSPGLVRCLIRAAREQHNASPRNALVVLDCAMLVLRNTTPGALRLEGDVWKERANALRLLGEYSGALAALDTAELCYRTFPAPAYDCAVVDWGRASVNFALKQFQTARMYAASAAEVFEAHGDTERLWQLRILEGSILFDEGNLEAAAHMFSSVVSVLSGGHDDETLARALANLSGCEIRLGAVREACGHGRRAASLYERLGMPAEAVRLYWSLGEAMRHLGLSEEAFACLRKAADHFEALDMLADAAAVSLDVAELLYERGDRREAAQLAARLLRHFREADAGIDAARALRLLQEAIARETATPLTFADTRMRTGVVRAFSLPGDQEA